MFGCSVRQDCGPNLALVGCYCLVLPVSVTILAEKSNDVIEARQEIDYCLVRSWRQGSPLCFLGQSTMSPLTPLV